MLMPKIPYVVMSEICGYVLGTWDGDLAGANRGGGVGVISMDLVRWGCFSGC